MRVFIGLNLPLFVLRSAWPNGILADRKIRSIPRCTTWPTKEQAGAFPLGLAERSWCRARAETHGKSARRGVHTRFFTTEPTRTAGHLLTRAAWAALALVADWLLLMAPPLRAAGSSVVVPGTADVETALDWYLMLPPLRRLAAGRIPK